MRSWRLRATSCAARWQLAGLVLDHTSGDGRFGTFLFDLELINQSPVSWSRACKREGRRGVADRRTVCRETPAARNQQAALLARAQSVTSELAIETVLATPRAGSDNCWTPTRPTATLVDAERGGASPARRSTDSPPRSSVSSSPPGDELTVVARALESGLNEGFWRRAMVRADGLGGGGREVCLAFGTAKRYHVFLGRRRRVARGLCVACVVACATPGAFAERTRPGPRSARLLSHCIVARRTIVTRRDICRARTRPPKRSAETSRR